MGLVRSSHAKVSSVQVRLSQVDPVLKEKLDTTDASHPIQVAENELKVAENPPGNLASRLKTIASSNSWILFHGGHECFLYSMELN